MGISGGFLVFGLCSTRVRVDRLVCPASPYKRVRSTSSPASPFHPCLNAPITQPGRINYPCLLPSPSNSSITLYTPTPEMDAQSYPLIPGAPMTPVPQALYPFIPIPHTPSAMRVAQNYQMAMSQPTPSAAYPPPFGGMGYEMGQMQVKTSGSAPSSPVSHSRLRAHSSNQQSQSQARAQALAQLQSQLQVPGRGQAASVSSSLTGLSSPSPGPMAGIPETVNDAMPPSDPTYADTTASANAHEPANTGPAKGGKGNKNPSNKAAKAAQPPKRGRPKGKVSAKKPYTRTSKASKSKAAATTANAGPTTEAALAASPNVATSANPKAVPDRKTIVNDNANANANANPKASAGTSAPPPDAYAENKFFEMHIPVPILIRTSPLVVDLPLLQAPCVTVPSEAAVEQVSLLKHRVTIGVVRELAVEIDLLEMYVKQFHSE